MMRIMSDITWMLTFALAVVTVAFPSQERLVRWIASAIAVVIVALGLFLP